MHPTCFKVHCIFGQGFPFPQPIKAVEILSLGLLNFGDAFLQMNYLFCGWLDVMLFKLDPTNLTWVENVVEEYMFVVPTIWEDENDDLYM